jgi:hypothetical protein
MESQISRELPRYRCFKEVWALKIESVEGVQFPEGARIIPVDPGYAPFLVDAEYVRRNCGAAGRLSDLVGGYYVVYKDGFKSWSPAEAFEQGYSRI